MQFSSYSIRSCFYHQSHPQTGCCLCFGSIPSFFLELFLHWSPVAYWAPTDLGSSSFSVLSFCLFMLLMGFSRKEYWCVLSFPSPVDHILSDLSTMTRQCWVAPRAWLSFIDLDKAVVHVIKLASCLWLWFQSVCSLMSSLSAQGNTNKTTRRYHLTWVRMAIMKMNINSNCCQGCGEKGPFVHCWWVCKLVQPFCKTVWSFLKKLKTELLYGPGFYSWVYIQKNCER